MPQRQALLEARPFTEADPAVEASTGRLRVQLINPGWGSSGFYSADVLSEAATQRVFPAGLQMFLDHPTATESEERPERSVRDLAAVLTSDAVLSESGALVAEAQVFQPYAPVLTEMRDAIGLSIRALGTFEMGEAEGRQGRIITSLDEARSVDFVTAAGRGGRILEVLESVRPSSVISRVMRRPNAAVRNLSESTVNDLRDALQTAIADAYNVADTTWAYVRDFDLDAQLVYFEVGGESPGTYQQGYTLGSGDGVSATLTGERIEVAVRTTYVPVDPAGQSITTESQGGTMPEIEEARLRQLETDAGRVLTLESERDAATQRAEQAEARLAEATARSSARPIVTAVVGESTTLPPASVARVIESVLASAPLTDAGGLDEAALRTAATEARTAAETEIAEALAAAGAGKISGFGASGATDVTESAYDQRSASVFNRPTVKGA